MALYIVGDPEAPQSHSVSLACQNSDPDAYAEMPRVLPPANSQTGDVYWSGVAETPRLKTIRNAPHCARRSSQFIVQISIRPWGSVGDG